MADSLITTVQIVSITAVALTVIIALLSRTLPWLRTRIISRALKRRLGTILTEGEIEQAVRYYVEPSCQNVDPSTEDICPRQKLFKTLDYALTRPTPFRYVFLLGEYGMGKSSALINYYAHHCRQSRRGFDIEVVHLSTPNADERIASVADKSGTVLFLDALDEDILAVADRAERLRNLLNATKEFRKVLITCRTKFFGKDEEMLTRVRIAKVGARSPGEISESFVNIYLSPFSAEEIKRYFLKRSPWVTWRVSSFSGRPSMEHRAQDPSGYLPALSKVDAALDLLSLFIPSRIMKEDAGDARQVINNLHQEGAPLWMIYVKLTSSILWILLAALREILTVTKKKSN